MVSPISDDNIRKLARETDEDFEQRMLEETKDLNDVLAAAHRTRQKARRTRAKNLAKQHDEEYAAWLAEQREQYGE